MQEARKSERLTTGGVFLNLFLFVIKLFAAIISGSATLFAEAFHSFTDVLSAAGVHFSIKISHKRADKHHPFGHARYQPIAAFVVSVLTAILGFEMFTGGIEALINPKEISFTPYVWIVLLLVVLVKLCMYIALCHAVKKHKEPGVDAMRVDSRHDMLIGIGVIASMIAYSKGYLWVDGVGSILLSIIIFKAAYDLFKDNSKYLLGAAPSKILLIKVKETVKLVHGVKGLHALRAHYVGDQVHLEVHIEVNGKLTTEQSHEISEKVRRHIEALDGIHRAFVHIDPR